MKILINSFIDKLEKNGHYDKANDKNNIEISANTNTLMSEMIINNNCKVDLGDIITLIVS